MRMAECHPDRKHNAKGLCRSCYMIHHRETHPDYRAYMRDYSRQWRLANPKKAASYKEEAKKDPIRRARMKATHKNCAYKKKYGMTLQEALRLLDSQGGSCAICQKDLDERTMNVDHCHATGAVRGILCSGCNTGLGIFGDTAESLRVALAYLERSQ